MEMLRVERRIRWWSPLPARSTGEGAARLAAEQGFNLRRTRGSGGRMAWARQWGGSPDPGEGRGGGGTVRGERHRRNPAEPKAAALEMVVVRELLELELEVREGACGLRGLGV